MKLKKILCVTLALVMSLTLLASCDGNNGGGEGLSYEEGADLATVEMVMKEGKDGKITEEVFEPSLLLQDYDYENMNVFQEAFKYTNVKPSEFVAPISDANQQYTLMISDTKNPMADIVVTNISTMNSAGDAVFVPLDELIDRHAPNIKKYFEENPEIKAQALAEDGKLYSIPSTYDAIVSQGWYIRKDWLDKLGLKVPTTVDEYYEVLTAFRNQDPNGNGKKDEIPYFHRTDDWTSLYQLWDAMDRWYIGEDDKVHHGWTEPSMKVAMQNIIKWRKEGLIDPEITSRQNAREVLLGNNLGGSTHDWFSSTGSFNKSVKENHKDEAWAQDFEWIAIVPPADINGVVKEVDSRSLMRGQGWGITVTNRYLVETIKYMDWWFTDQGKLTYWYGMEGVDYVINAEGKPEFTDTVLNSQNGVPMYLRKNGQLEQGAPMSMEAEMAGMVPEALQGFKLYQDSVNVLPQMPTLAHTTEEKEISAQYGTSLQTFIDETISKWYVGDTELTDEAWNKYLEEAEKRGLSKVIEIRQTAYDRLVSRGGGVDKAE